VNATGGAAWIGVKNSITDLTGAINYASITNTRLGWAAGLGVEWAFAEHWTGKVEYLFMQAVPSVTAPLPTSVGGGTIAESSMINDNIIRGGINFKF